MINLDRILKALKQNGVQNVLIHTISGTTNWLIAQKIEPNKWLITLCDPMKNVTYNIGNVNNEEHLRLWYELTHREILLHVKNMPCEKIAQEFKKTLKMFINKSEYKHFLKVYNKVLF